jgi:hypothetical protein
MTSGFDVLSRRRFVKRRGAGMAALSKFLLIALGCAMFLGLVVLRG